MRRITRVFTMMRPEPRSDSHPHKHVHGHHHSPRRGTNVHVLWSSNPPSRTVSLKILIAASLLVAAVIRRSSSCSLLSQVGADTSAGGGGDVVKEKQKNKLVSSFCLSPSLFFFRWGERDIYIYREREMKKCTPDGARRCAVCELWVERRKAKDR